MQCKADRDASIIEPSPDRTTFCGEMDELDTSCGKQRNRREKLLT